MIKMWIVAIIICAGCFGVGALFAEEMMSHIKADRIYKVDQI